MEKRGWIQDKYLIKAYLEDMSYESAKTMLNFTFNFLLNIWYYGRKKRVLKTNFETPKK